MTQQPDSHAGQRVGERADYQPYAWPRPDHRTVKAAKRQRREKRRRQRAVDPKVNPFVAVLVMGATVIAMIVLNVQVYKHADRQYDWAANAGTVQQVLNDKYVEDIQVIREKVAAGRSSTWKETFGIDGVVRTDCTVPDDTDPTIVCDGPLTLTAARNRVVGSSTTDAS